VFAWPSARGGIRTYLEPADGGRPNQPLRLFPLYTRTGQVRGGQADRRSLLPKPVFPSPRRDRSTGVQSPASPRAVARAARRYQRGLLKWLKKDASARKTCARRSRRSRRRRLEPQRAFWWVSLAFFDAPAQRVACRTWTPSPVHRIGAAEQRLAKARPASPSGSCARSVLRGARSLATDWCEVRKPTPGESIPHVRKRGRGGRGIGRAKAAPQQLSFTQGRLEQVRLGQRTFLLHSVTARPHSGSRSRARRSEPPGSRRPCRIESG